MLIPWPDVNTFGWLIFVSDSWLNSAPTCPSPRINIPNLGRASDRMHLIIVFPGSAALSHLYFCLPHLSRSLILQSWQPVCHSLSPRPTQSTSRPAHMSPSYPCFSSLPLLRFFSPLRFRSLITLRPSTPNLKHVAAQHHCSASADAAGKTSFPFCLFLLGCTVILPVYFSVFDFLNRS